MTRKLPKAVAELTGAADRNPKRYRSAAAGRRSPRPIGAPYATMAAAEKDAWRDFVSTLPWLAGSHRAILRLACVIRVRVETGENPGVSLMSAYSALLSKLGASPSDEARVRWTDPDEDTDPMDRFFQ